jgi:hypothetical protein
MFQKILVVVAVAVAVCVQELGEVMEFILMTAIHPQTPPSQQALRQRPPISVTASTCIKSSRRWQQPHLSSSLRMSSLPTTQWLGVLQFQVTLSLQGPSYKML